MKLVSTLFLMISIYCIATAQSFKDTTSKKQYEKYSYAYITVEGKGFGKKLKVDVDFGDTPEQINEGKEYSETLTNKKSYAAVLNHMSDKGYELVESRDNNYSFQGVGSTYNIIFIMRRKR